MLFDKNIILFTQYFILNHFLKIVYCLNNDNNKKICIWLKKKKKTLLSKFDTIVQTS